MNNINYHAEKNKLGFLSNSDLKKFKEDKSRFKEVVIEGKSDYIEKTAYFVGSRVDDILTSNTEYELEDYYSPDVLKRDNEQVFTKNKEYKQTGEKKVVSVNVWNEIQGCVSSVKANKFYQDYCQNAEKQVVLSMPYKLSHGFTGLCGMLDFLLIKGNIAYITDLKTSREFLPIQLYNETDEEYKTRCQKYYYMRCLDYGYIAQGAMYTQLILHTYPEVKEVIFNHLTVEKIEGFPCTVIRFSPETLEKGWQYLLSVIDELNNTTIFHPKYKYGNKPSYNSNLNCLTI